MHRRKTMRTNDMEVRVHPVDGLSTYRPTYRRRTPRAVTGAAVALAVVVLIALVAVFVIPGGTSGDQLSASTAASDDPTSGQSSGETDGADDAGESDGSDESGAAFSWDGVSSVPALDVPAVQQNPELPTGCESVSLTNALSYWGFELSKTEIADSWMPTSSTDFVTAFLGDPHTSYGHSIAAPGLTATANAYLEAQGSDLVARDVTGAEFGSLLDYVGAGVPVVVYGTIGMAYPNAAYASQTYEGRTYYLFDTIHCLVLCGYDADADAYVMSDPLEGTVSYDASTVEAVYEAVGSQAIVVLPEDE